MNRNLAVLCLVAAINSATAASDPAWPFEQPDPSTLRQSPRKVFAHYHTDFTLWPTVSPHPDTIDFYKDVWMDPGYNPAGPLMQELPLEPRQSPWTMTAGDWRLENLKLEVRRAVALGLDGFALLVLNNGGAGHWAVVNRMLDAIEAVNDEDGLEPKFTAMLMPNAAFQPFGNPATLATAMVTLAAHPSAMRVYDGECATPTGCVVVAPYDAQVRKGSWWAAWKVVMQARGQPVAFVPVFQNYWATLGTLKVYDSISYGYSDWGSASLSYQAGFTDSAKYFHDRGMVWMAPLRTQDSRTKPAASGHAPYWENVHSEAFREGWRNAIGQDGGDADRVSDWVQIATWNDYSEHSEISPSTLTQFGLYDLTAYYTTWFKTRTQPAITRDVLYYFHRTHAATAVPSEVDVPYRFEQQQHGAPTPHQPASNRIELLAFLTAGGELRIKLGGTISSQTVATGGIHSFSIPIGEGTPEFELRRGAPLTRVTCVKSHAPISNAIDYENLLYVSGSSTRALPHPAGPSGACSSW